MKFYKRLFSLLLVFVLSFGAFSIGVSAESVNDNVVYQMAPWSVKFNTASSETYYSGTTEDSWYYFYGNINANLSSAWTADFQHTITRQDGSPIAKKGETFTFRLDNVTAYFTFNTSYRVDPQKFDSIYYELRYTDNTQVQYLLPDSAFTYNSSTKTHYINIENITAAKDLQGIRIIYKYTPTTRIGLTGSYEVSMYFHHAPFNPVVDIETKEEGLLGGILGKITELWEVATAGFANLVQGITELPQKLWNLISEGLKNLFVPDEQYMAEYSDKWDELLSERFGAIYQVGTIIVDFAERIQVSDKTNTIYFPSVSLNSVGIPFSFGGYDVQVVPTGFDALIEVCKKIISVACTFLFVNGLRKRYDEVMGVEQ